MDIIRDVENDASSAVRDIRAALPKLMTELGVNTSNERACVHAVLIWIVSELAKIVKDGGAAAEIASVI